MAATRGRVRRRALVMLVLALGLSSCGTQEDTASAEELAYSRAGVRESALEVADVLAAAGLPVDGLEGSYQRCGSGGTGTTYVVNGTTGAATGDPRRQVLQVHEAMTGQSWNRTSSIYTITPSVTVERDGVALEIAAAGPEQQLVSVRFTGRCVRTGPPAGHGTEPLQ